MLNLPHPFRLCAFGKPNSGKGMCVKNILLRADPPFERVTVIHPDSEGTREYEDLGGGENVEIRSDIPPPNEWDGDVKHLVIVDDVEVKSLQREQYRNLDRLFGYVSTHKNISVCLCSQDFHNVPVIVRRCSNFFILWDNPDLLSMAHVAKKTGLTAHTLKKIFSTFNDPHDSLWVDLTDRTPYKTRKNGYTLLRCRE